MTIREALTLLELSVPVNHADVRRAFRIKARQYHPDKFKESESKKNASENFIKVKKANDMLMGLAEAQINSISPANRASRVKKIFRERKQIDYPIIKEIDNVARLLHLINKQGKSTRVYKYIASLKFSPVDWLGKYYEKLFEVRYPGEENLRGLSFVLLRLFRLIFGSVVLIAGLFALAFIGLTIAIFIGPAILFFLGVYQIYHALVNASSKKVTKTFLKNASRRDSRRTYLIIRSVLFILLPVLIFFLLFFIVPPVWYLRIFLGITGIPILFLMLSIAYEWRKFPLNSSKST